MQNLNTIRRGIIKKMEDISVSDNTNLDTTITEILS